MLSDRNQLLETTDCFLEHSRILKRFALDNVATEDELQTI